jgi:hypothetical protein
MGAFEMRCGGQGTGTRRTVAGAWSYHLFHAVVRYPQELKVFEREGVTCHPFYDLLANLCRRADHAFSGSAGGDLAEIVGYYNSAQSKKPEQSP